MVDFVTFQSLILGILCKQSKVTQQVVATNENKSECLHILYMEVNVAIESAWVDYERNVYKDWLGESCVGSTIEYDQRQIIETSLYLSLLLKHVQA